MDDQDLCESDDICFWAIRDVLLENTFKQIDTINEKNTHFSLVARSVCSDIFDVLELDTVQYEAQSLPESSPSKNLSSCLKSIPDEDTTHKTWTYCEEEPKTAAIDVHARNFLPVRPRRSPKSCDNDVTSISSSPVQSTSWLPSSSKHNAGRESVSRKPMVEEPLLEKEISDPSIYSHLLSMNTPRVLTPSEQERRRDILAYLEYCDEKDKKIRNIEESYELRKKEFRRDLLGLRGTDFTYDHNGEIVEIEADLPTSSKLSQGRVNVTTDVYSIRSDGSKVRDTPDGQKNKQTKKHSAPRKRKLQTTKNANNEPSPPKVNHTSYELPVIETSRLSPGVKAIYGSVEKTGPKRVPSRKSRLRRHNYTTDGSPWDSDGEEDNDKRAKGPSQKNSESDDARKKRKRKEIVASSCNPVPALAYDSGIEAEMQSKLPTITTATPGGKHKPSPPKKAKDTQGRLPRISVSAKQGMKSHRTDKPTLTFEKESISQSPDWGTNPPLCPSPNPKLPHKPFEKLIQQPQLHRTNSKLRFRGCPVRTRSKMTLSPAERMLNMAALAT